MRNSSTLVQRNESVQLLAAALCESPKELYCRNFYSSGQSRWAVKLSALTNAISETCSIGGFGREIIFAGCPNGAFRGRRIFGKMSLRHFQA